MISAAEKGSDDEQIKSLLGYAILAPSSHNTQPWQFEIRDGSVFLRADRMRALAVNDPEDRELTISCGCALMNLRVAAAHAGIGISLEMTPDPQDDELLAVVSFDGKKSPPAGDFGLFGSIEGRRTYRKRFVPEAVPAAVLDALVAVALQEGCWLDIIGSDEKRHQVAALVAQGDAIQWSNPSWRRELAAWIHPRRRGDGLALPGVVAPFAQAVVRTFDMGKGVAAKDRQLADESPVLAVVGTSGDEVADWLAAGQGLQKILLSAYAQGLQASYLNQPIQIASLRPELKCLLNEQGFPQVLLRLGFAEGHIDAAPRRSLADMIE